LSRIPIIIPFYQERQKLECCLAHLHAQSHGDTEIFVRDNTRDNIYFTAAVNEGLRKFCYDPAIQYVMILNQDAYLQPSALQMLCNFLDRNPDSGIAAPLQLTPQSLVTWGGSLRGFPTGTHKCDPVESYDRPVETYWANGAAMMIRTEVVREVGLWDRNLRFVCSDQDFSLSARARGWKVHVVPEARCAHELSTTGDIANLEIELIKLKDIVYFGRKWLSGDLYRALSFEGSSLTALSVRLEIEKLQNTVAKLERMPTMNTRL
jgi:GT2 family glycosyltransferase